MSVYWKKPQQMYVSGFMMVSRVKGKVVSEVLRKYDVCVK